MTLAIPFHRAISTKLAPRGFNVVTRWGYNPWLARVNSTANTENDIDTPRSYLQSKSRYFIATRSYATKAAAKPASRPKAHTGRTPAKRSTKASTSSKPGPKTAAGKKAVGRKPKTTTKTTTKAATKTAPKPRKSAVKKPPSAAALLRERRARDKELKEKALLNSATPKTLPSSAWTVVFSEAQTGSHSFGDASNIAKEAAQKFRNLTPEEKEHYNHIANQNKAANIAAEKKWISQFTPDQIREANNARALLKKRYAEQHPNARPKHFTPIKDDRQVKHVRSSYIRFSTERWASGDFAHMTVAESSKLISREWKALDPAEKKKYEDETKADMNRYTEEAASVYQKSPAST